MISDVCVGNTAVPSNRFVLLTPSGYIKNISVFWENAWLYLLVFSVLHGVIVASQQFNALREIVFLLECLICRLQEAVNIHEVNLQNFILLPQLLSY